jgi:cyclopropane fatty-acyl-phospholipid synthase-like methyltransferase
MANDTSGNKTNSMLGINSYGDELTQDEIDKNVHRGFVGGLWKQLGQLQFDFLVKNGLRPSHKLVDIGCGCLRGGVHYIKYLDKGNYYGLDVNQSLIEAGIQEIKKEALGPKQPVLMVDNQFRLGRFNANFDFMVSISLFTHLPMNIIIRCLSEARKCLAPEGTYFATFFEAPHSACIDKIVQVPAEITSMYDADPFHYSHEEMSWMGRASGLETRIIGDWNHPRNQKMAAFTIKQ